MTLEAYAVGVSLNLTSNMPQALAQMMRELERFNRLLKSTTDSMALMEKAIGPGMKDAVKSAEVAARAWQTTAKSMTEAASALGRATARGSAGGKGGAGSHDLLLAGMLAAGAGSSGLSFLGGSVGSAMDFGHLQAVLRADTRVSPAQIKAASDAAFAAARNVPGTTPAANLSSIVDLKSVTGSLDDAVLAMPAFAKLGVVLRAMGDAKGDPTFAAAKAEEILGHLTDDRTHTVSLAELQRHLELMTKVAVGSNMRVDPDAYLAFAKNARAGGMGLTDQALYEDMPALFMTLGGGRSGTAMKAMFDQLVNGKMTAENMRQLQKLGVLDKSASWSHGRVVDIGKHLLGGGDTTGARVQDDPVQWARKYLMERFKAMGITDPVAMAKAVSTFSQRATGEGGLAEIVRALVPILKEAENYRNTTGDTFGNFANTDPRQKLVQFQAAWTTFLTSLGETVLPQATAALQSLTEALTALTKWAKDNPGLATTAVDVAAGLSAIAVALGTLSTAVFIFGPALRLLGFGGAAAAGGEAAAGAAAGAGLAGLGLPGALAAAGLVGTAYTVNALGQIMYGGMPRTAADWPVYDPSHAAAALPNANAGAARPSGGDVYLDGVLAGKWMDERLARAANRPLSGVTGPDVRLGIMPGLSPW